MAANSMLVDSHCHLDRIDLTPYGGDLSKALAAARDVGVGHFLTVGVTLQEHNVLCAIAEKHANVFLSVGLHPNEVVENEPTIETIKELAKHPKVIAIGETGLDFYRTESAQSWQLERFRTHIGVAKELKKPLIIHSRQARQETIQILKEENAKEIGGVMHCFTEDWEMASKALDLGFYVSFSGIITFKNAEELRDVIKKMPLDRILVETDCPYLAPVPMRGKSNEPAYVKYVAEKVAELKGVSFDQIVEQTTKNFNQCFRVR